MMFPPPLESAGSGDGSASAAEACILVGGGGGTYSSWFVASVVHGIAGVWDTVFGCLLRLGGRDFESVCV